MIIHLNENAFHKLFLIEGNHSKSSKRTREIIANQNGLSADDPRVIESEREFSRKYFSHGLDSDWFITLEPFAYKWLLNSGAFEYNVRDIVKLINKHASKAKSVEDRTAFMQQIKSLQTFEDVMNFIASEERKERDDIRNGNIKVNLNQNYRVLGPLSFEEAKEYGKYSGAGAGKEGMICYTESIDTWKSRNYSNRGANKCFLLLRNDWQTVEAVHDGSEKNNGLGEPFDQLNGYDDYGLSMIFVWITPMGTIHESNTRWNHKAKFITDNVDQALTVGALQDLMGASFGNIFGVETFYDTADPAYDDLANGKNINEVFDSVIDKSESVAIVKLMGVYNVFSLKNNRLLYPYVWFDEISDFTGEFAKVVLGGKLNIINKEGKLLSKNWLDNVLIYHNDIAFAKLNNKWAYIDTNGNMLGNQWFDKIYAFRNGVAQVVKGGRIGKIDLNGKLMWL